MSMAQVPLILQTNRPIWLVQNDNGVVNFNMTTGQYDFKIYKGSQSDIDFVVRNVDRKPIRLVGKTLTITIINELTGVTLLQRVLKITDDINGLARLMIYPTDMKYWPVGYLTYSILITNEDNSQNMLYVSLDQGARGYLQVIDGLLPHPSESVTILASDFHTESWLFVPVTHFVSGSYSGNQSRGIDSALHTLAVYCTNFKGKFWVQGTLDNDPPDSHDDWFHIQLGTIHNHFTFDGTMGNGFTGIEPFSFEANLTWIRFIFLPDLDNVGSLDKILLKN